MSPSFGQRLAGRGDLILAVTIVAVVGMMLVPLPTLALDLLLTVNIATAVVLLLVGLYINSPLGLSTLPGLLLVTTLFRLGLNISSTRLILLQADAGQVIDAFGTFVVQGDYVVGAVVFLIITLVQFLVIARGSERVAEVSARFTLDAMPGRQMAIDADLRAGALTLEQARQQREELQLESRLYGALDGAMKFVKGDAIAGLLITAINIVGGLAIGVLQRGLPIDQAARTYTLLTIGDGLVSQIPALLIATAAGLIVTRVGVGSSNLGSDAVGQILRHPRALGITAAFLALLALVPGLPTVPFAILALLAAGLAWRAGDMGSEAEDGVALGVAAPMVQPLRLMGLFHTRIAEM
ncbi:MAG: flagellar biosynthesis protein FlhA, partial [Myxococcota bacterium]